MRELFVYYRVRASDASAVGAVTHDLQARLRERHPELRARVLHRPDAQDGHQTWMETYSTDPALAPAGVDAALQAAIEVEAKALQPLLAGPRHTEVFVECAS